MTNAVAMFQIRSLDLERSLELKFHLENALHQRFPDKHFQALLDFKVSGIGDPTKLVFADLSHLRRALAFRDSVPLLLTSLSGTAGGGWGQNARDVEVHLVVAWRGASNIKRLEIVLSKWGVPLCVVEQYGSPDQQVQAVLDSMRKEHLRTPVLLRKESITRSHRKLVIAPGIDGGTLSTWQQVARRVFGQEVGLSSVIEAQKLEAFDHVVANQYETGRFDWVVFCPEDEGSESGKNIGRSKWVPLLAIEYDGKKDDKPEKMKATNFICHSAGLTLVRCSYKDFKGSGQPDMSFQRDLVHHLIQVARPVTSIRSKKVQEDFKTRRRFENTAKLLQRDDPHLLGDDLRMEIARRLVEQDVEAAYYDPNDWQTRRYDACQWITRMIVRDIELRIAEHEGYTWGELYAKPRREGGSWQRLLASPRMKFVIYPGMDGTISSDTLHEFLEKWVLRNYFERNHPDLEVPI